MLKIRQLFGTAKYHVSQLFTHSKGASTLDFIIITTC